MPDEEQKDLYQKEQEAQTESSPHTSSEGESAEGEALGSFYKPDKPKGSRKNRLQSMLGKKIVVGGVGAGLAAIIIAIIALFGFLNVFKLEHIMKNIEGKAFMRYQVSMDGRSSKWINAYLVLRFGEVDDPDKKPIDRDNMWFRANKVSDDNPLKKWYQTMRTSKFEDDLWKKHGIRFTSKMEKHGNIYRVRWAKIRIKNNIYNLELPTGNIDISDTNQLNGTARKFFEEVETFDSDKAARIAIKQAVESETKSWQVIKRRHLRKNIQNMIGVRNWRFFEQTRDKLDEKKRSIRNKIIATALPEDTVTGKFIQCIFGMIKCDSTTDPSDPKNQAGGDASSGKPKNDGHENDADVDSEGNPILNTEADDEIADAVSSVANEAASEALEGGSEEAVEVGLRTMFMKKIIAQVAGFAAGPLKAIDIIGWIDSIARISQGIKDHSLSRMVTLARGAQAMGLFSLYMTANDQLKTGEVTGQEVGEFMQTVGSVSNSEGWTSVMSNSKESAKAEGLTAAKNKEEYCSKEHQEAILLPQNKKVAEQEFAYLCDDMKIGGNTRASAIEEWWDKYLGPIVNPILTVYNASGLGSIFSNVAKFVGDVFGAITEAIGGPIFNGVVKILGLEDNLQSLSGWLVSSIASALGAGPTMDGNEPSGVYMNQLIQGGAYTAESSARSQGAAATTTQTAALARKMAQEYSQEKSNIGLYEKYASLENKDSATSNLLFNAVENAEVNNFASTITNVIKRVAKAPFNILFNNKANADTDSPYAASKFAGIDTYDFPQQCFELDPLTMTPQQATNADDNGWIPANELTWELVNNNQDFYAKLYENIRSRESDTAKVEEAALKIYNCAAMDTTIRGGLGFMYGYTEDNGLETSQSTGTETASTGTCEGLTLGQASSGHGSSDVGNHEQYQLPKDPPKGYFEYSPDTMNGKTREDKWGRKELVQTIYWVGKKWGEKYPNGPKFGVGDMDEALYNHLSHANGVDVDISGCPLMMSCTSNYDQEKSKELAKMFFEAGNIDLIIYNDSAVRSAAINYAKSNNLPGTMMYLENHHHHFHVRIKEGKSPAGC